MSGDVRRSYGLFLGLAADETIRPRLRDQLLFLGLIDLQVKQKNFVIKSAYAMIKGIKKKFVPEVVDALLDDWLGVDSSKVLTRSFAKAKVLRT